MCCKCENLISPNTLRFNCKLCDNIFCNICRHVAACEDHDSSLYPEMNDKEMIVTGRNIAEIALAGLKCFGPQPLFGRNRKWVSYSQAYEKVSVATSLLPREKKGCVYGVICANTDEVSCYWMIAMILLDLVVVPIAPNQKSLEILQDLSSEYLLVYDERFVDASSLSNPKIEIGTIFAENTNSDYLFEFKEERPRKDSDICCILFTSGTTGKPKGTLFTESLCMPSENVTLKPFVRADLSAFDPSFLPSLIGSLRCGGSRYFIHEMDSLFEELAFCRPTHFGAPPAIWSLLYFRYLDFLKDTLGDKAAAIRQTKALIGNRLHVATSGGAAISMEIHHFVNSVLGIHLVDLYGSRETGGIAKDGIVYRGVKVLVRNDENGELLDSGKGELCVNSPRMISAYVNAENSGKFVCNAEGKRFYRTGDIGELFTAENGEQRLKIVDRVKFIWKNERSEWVNPSEIELALEESPLVFQSLCFGVPSTNDVCCVLVTKAHDPELIRNDLRYFCNQRRIAVPSRMILESFDNRWTVENGLLTSTMKKDRMKLLERYQNRSDFLSTKSETAKKEELHPILLQALNYCFQNKEERFQNRESLLECGASSIEVAMIMQYLRKNNAELDINSLMEYSLAHLSDIIKRKEEGFCVNSYHSIDWNKEMSLEVEESLASESVNEQGRAIVVVGASGFLGSFLVRSLIKHHPSKEICCIVRAESEEKAVERLRDVKCERLHVFRGDITEKNAGLSDKNLELLCKMGVSDVFHNASTVSLSLPFSALKEKNVGGLLNVLTLCLSRFGKGVRFHLISSVGATGSPKEVYEEITPKVLDVKDSGYGQTKAINECILMRMSRKYGFPAFLYRPGTIGPDKESGLTNTNDFGCLLMKVCHDVKCFPDNASLEMSWISVNECAEAIALISSLKTLEKNVFHFQGNAPKAETLFKCMRERFPEMEKVTPQKWRAKVKELLASKDHPAFSVANVMLNIHFGGVQGGKVETEETNALVPGIVSEYNDEDIKRMISWMSKTAIFQNNKNT